jgi:phospholipid/cholesterol/gamma-HCH transport system substrate-binding protein
METNVHYTTVGAFVIILVAAITLGIIWLSSGFTLQTTTNYMIYMTESVSGLNVDSTVEYNGVGVGVVSSINLNRKNPQLVEVLLRINNKTPVTKGTVATLSTRGITGVAYIGLKDTDTDLAPLRAKHGEKYPVIPTAPSIFMRLDTALKQLTTNLRKVTETFQSLLDQENQRSIKLILLNIKTVTGEFAKNNQKISEILANTAKASQQLTPFLQNGTGAVKTFQTQTLPATYRILGNVNEITRNLVDVTNELKQDPSILIRGAARQPLGPGEK